jgi:hypothetical protein
MRIKNIFLVSAFILPSLAIINAQASETLSPLKIIQKLNNSNLKVELELTKNLLIKTEAEREKKLISLKRYKEIALKQKKSLYSSKFSKTKLTMEREIEGINHSGVPSVEKSRSKKDIEKYYYEELFYIEKAKISRMGKLTKIFDNKIKSSKITFDKRIASLKKTIASIKEKKVPNDFTIPS